MSRSKRPIILNPYLKYHLAYILLAASLVSCQTQTTSQSLERPLTATSSTISPTTPNPPQSSPTPSPESQNKTEQKAPFYSQSKEGYAIQLVKELHDMGMIDSLAMDANNHLFLATRYVSAFQLYKLDLGTAQTELLYTPPPDSKNTLIDITFGPDEKLYLADEFSECIYEFKDKQLQTWLCDDRLSSFSIANGLQTNIFFEDKQLYLSTRQRDQETDHKTLPIIKSYTITDGKLELLTYVTSPHKTSTGFYFHTNGTTIQVSHENGYQLEIGKRWRTNDFTKIGPGCGSFDRICPMTGHVDGRPDLAEFNMPRHLVVGRDDTVYVSDTGNKVLRTINQHMQVGTVPLKFEHPIENMALDNNGDIIAVHGNQIIKIVIPK